MGFGIDYFLMFKAWLLGMLINWIHKMKLGMRKLFMVECTKVSYITIRGDSIRNTKHMAVSVPWFRVQVFSINIPSKLYTCSVL